MWIQAPINYFYVRNSLEQLFENGTIDEINQRLTVMSMAFSAQRNAVDVVILQWNKHNI